MISEDQIREVLKICETNIGAGALDKLRKDLMGQKRPKEAIWELLVLFACIEAVPKVVFEPTSSSPDIHLYDDQNNLILYVEAVFTESRCNNLSNSLNDLGREIYKEIAKNHESLTRLHIRLEKLSDPNKPPTAPDKHLWVPEIIKPIRHLNFQDLLLTGKQRINFDTYDLSAIITQEESSRGFTTGFLTPGLPKKFTDHPCYKVIKKKGRQAKNWPSDVTQKPILLAIGTDSSSHEFDQDLLRQAVYSALLDSKKIPLVTRVNLLNHWSDKPARFHVDGSKYISSVLFIQIKSGYDLGYNKRNPHLTLFHNEHCLNPVTEKIKTFIGDIHFGKLAYGPGWESWQEKPKERYRRDGGSMKIIHKGNQLCIELPSNAVLRALSGESSLDEMYDYAPNDQGSLMKILRRALEDGRKIEDISIIKGNALTREPDRIAFELSDQVENVIKVPKSERKL